jgi:hypothetical protein
MARRLHATRHPEPEDDTPVLLELFREIADRWELPVQARLALLGGSSRTTHVEWTRGEIRRDETRLCLAPVRATVPSLTQVLTRLGDN